MNDEAPGWDAIERPFRAAYSDREPMHWGTNTPASLGGAFDGISAYRCESGWHFVTFGLTDLYSTDGGGNEVSGLGYELTLLTAAAATPQPWAVRLLGSIATMAAEKGLVLAPGHRVETGPIDGAGSDLVAVALTEDSLSPALESPAGKFQLLRLVGITAEQLARAKDSSTAEMLAEAQETNPALVTDA